MIRRWGQVAVALTVAMAGPAVAQTPPAPPVETPPAPPAAPVESSTPAPPPAVDPALAARLDEMEQIARIADRKVEILEAALVKKEKEAPLVTADEKGFVLRSHDGAYQLRIRALLQVDGRFFLDNDSYAANDTFLIRRFRPSLEGTLFSLVDYKLVPDFAGGQVQLYDVYLDIHPATWLRFRAGKFKGPIGLERLQGVADLPLFERAIDQNLSPTREIGAQVWGTAAGGLVTYVAGVVNGAPDNTNPDVDTNHAKDFQARLFVQPFSLPGLSELGDLGLGVAASTGNRKGKLPSAVSGSPVPTTASVTGLGSYKTAGSQTFFSYYNPTTDTTGALTTFAAGRSSHLNPQLYYYVGPFGLLAEYVWSRQAVQRGNSTAVLTNQAGHATASFVVGGTESYRGPTPEHGFDPAKGWLGALELSARVAWLKVDPDTFGDPNVPGSTAYADPAKSARSATAFGVIATWVLRRSLHLGLMFEQTRFDGGAGTASAVKDRPTENLLLGRAQLNF